MCFKCLVPARALAALPPKRRTLLTPPRQRLGGDFTGRDPLSPGYPAFRPGKLSYDTSLLIVRLMKGSKAPAGSVVALQGGSISLLPNRRPRSTRESRPF